MNFKIIIPAFYMCFALLNSVRAQPFNHPGILHSREDLMRMKKAVALKQEPIYSGFKLFAQNPVSSFNYKMRGPLNTVGRNPTVGQDVYDTDANAAHQNAIMWAITGEKAYAQKAIEIVNAWSSALNSITGRDAVLMAGLGPFKMVNAAEILRYTNAGWKASDIKHAEVHFKKVIYPVLKDFAPFANGNWDAAAIKTVLSIAVFCNDRAMFERALRYYVNGQGNGRLTNYVINETGQIQESGRDQGHTQLGIAMLAESSEIAWHQGLDLYGYADNRLLKGFEYVAKFNLGNEVPFVETLDRTGKYHHTTIARQDRGPLRAIYEQVYNHYCNHMGLAAPFTQQAAEKIRPEGPGKPGADHPGYGTLFFSRAMIRQSNNTFTEKPAAPGAVIASYSDHKVALNWIAAVGANSYVVKRALKEAGPYTVLATAVSGTTFQDNKVKDHQLYYYRVYARNPKGESPGSVVTSICAGLPVSWDSSSIGQNVAGNTAFDGKLYNIEAGGIGLDSLSDQFHFSYQILNGDGSITIRYVPQLSSQFSSFGLSLRDELSNNSAHSSIIIYPGKTSQIEAPGWQVRFIARSSSGNAARVGSSVKMLNEPVVSFGRMTGQYWLKLERKGNKVLASGSVDGKEWVLIADQEVSLKKHVYAGIVVASGLANQTTRLMFDNVSVVQSQPSR